jgi:hypothetical protein
MPDMALVRPTRCRQLARLRRPFPRCPRPQPAGPHAVSLAGTRLGTLDGHRTRSADGGGSSGRRCVGLNRKEHLGHAAARRPLMPTRAFGGIGDLVEQPGVVVIAGSEVPWSRRVHNHHRTNTASRAR